MINIKNIITIFVIFVSTLINAQMNPGDNTLDPYIDKFVGTWKWENGNNSLILFLKKENISLPVLNNVHSDILFGFHKFIQNGTIIEDNLGFSYTSFNEKKSSILGNSEDNNHDRVLLYMDHISKKKNIDIIIQYIDLSHIKIISVKNPSGTKLKPYDKTISLPQDIILTKQ